jgi:pyruvate, water dikinase
MEIPGVVLVDSRVRSVRGLCNHTGAPIDGAILVVDRMTPELFDTIVTSAAVICAKGGRTGHMESLCRSRGIPVLRVDSTELEALVGEATVRLDRGSVVLGGNVSVPRPSAVPTATLDDVDSVCVVISDAEDIRSTNAVEQVRSYFVREEFVCFGAGLSPVDAVRAGRRAAERYGAAVAAELCTMVRELLPGQRLVLRLLDLRSDDAARITTDAEVADEPNPELGLHGARWLLAERHYPSAFHTLRAHVRDRLGADADRLSFAVPFVNDEHEFLRLREHLGLTEATRLGVFVETPAAVHSATGFCAAGAGELFVGTKDLVQFCLAADRGNHLVAASYQTRHPAVLGAVRQVLRSGRDAGVPVHVFALGTDVAHYVRHLRTRRLMMCTAELKQLARSTRGIPDVA